VKLHFLGANRQVTGSRYCLETGKHRVMIDCGLFQEREFAARNWQPCPVPAETVDALLLTHAHIDHCGLLPKLVKDGFSGPVYATRPSVELARIMLRDSARIQMEDAAYKRRRHKKEGRKKNSQELLYEENDLERTLPLLRGVDYSRPVEIASGITATFYDAGHILGSAMIRLEVEEDGRTETVLFSGDIGQWDKPIIRDPTILDQATYVVMESTYGNRDHPDAGDTEAQLAAVIHNTVQRGGKVVIPVFAVERAQELMYYFGRLLHANRIPRLPVFLDSPMAVDVTSVFHKFRDCFDEEAWELIRAGGAPLQFEGLQMCRTADQSKAINKVDGPAIIMSTSGMCTAGRIKHHLRQTIASPQNTVLFVGYQGRGTLGRQILEKPPHVRIHGRDYPVRAEIGRIYGFSAHAGRADLLRWFAGVQKDTRRVFLTHGDEDVALALAEEINRRTPGKAVVPEYGETVEL